MKDIIFNMTLKELYMNRLYIRPFAFTLILLTSSFVAVFAQEDVLNAQECDTVIQYPLGSPSGKFKESLSIAIDSFINEEKTEEYFNKCKFIYVGLTKARYENERYVVHLSLVDRFENLNDDTFSFVWIYMNYYCAFYNATIMDNQYYQITDNRATLPYIQTDFDVIDDTFNSKLLVFDGDSLREIVDWIEYYKSSIDVSSPR